MKKLFAVMVAMLVVLMVSCSAFSEGTYPEVESMIPEGEDIWFSMVFTMTGDPEFEEAPDPHKTYTVVVYTMKADDELYGKPSYLGLYENGKNIDLYEGYLVPEVTKSTAVDTVNAIMEQTEHDLPTVYFWDVTYYGD